MIKKNGFTLKLFISLIFFSISVVLYSSPIVRVAFVHLEGENITSQLERAVNEVILSFTNEIKGYVIEDFSQSNEENINMIGGLEYILTGRIVGLDQGVRLELVLKNKQRQIVRNMSKDYEGSNKILLESRLLVKELFESQDIVNADIDEKNNAKSDKKLESSDISDFKPI